jgi:hypothetical protein
MCLCAAEGRTNPQHLRNLADMELVLTGYGRGDGACGKTSLLNVFTRGYVFRLP